MRMATYHYTRNMRGQARHYAKRGRVRLWLMTMPSPDVLIWPVNDYNTQTYYRMAKRLPDYWPDFLRYLRKRLGIVR